jgi:hypothetical protein
MMRVSDFYIKIKTSFQVGVSFGKIVSGGPVEETHAAS